jgi:hypothetical protein
MSVSPVFPVVRAALAGLFERLSNNGIHLFAEHVDSHLSLIIESS